MATWVLSVAVCVW